MTRGERTTGVTEFYNNSYHPHTLTYDECGDSLLQVGGKAFNMGILARNGIRVPQGICVTTDAHEAYLRDGSIDPTLIDMIAGLRTDLGGNIAIRSSATCEDGAELSLAGVFDTHYLGADDDIETAMRSIYDQSQSPEVLDHLQLHFRDKEEVRMGLVVQRLIAAEKSGVMYTGVDEANTLIQYVDGFGADLVDGNKEGASILVDGEGRIMQSKGYRNDKLSTQQVDKLMEAGRSIQEIFGDNLQDIEFAFENGELIILQARPLTTRLDAIELYETSADTLEAVKQQLSALALREMERFSTSSVVFSDTNFSELLPRPAEMDFGVFSYIFTGSDDIPGAIQLGRIEMGYPLTDESVGYMHYIGGRPYLSILGDAHTYYAGFPDTKEEYTATFVQGYLDAVNHDPSKGSYPEMGLYIQDPTFAQLHSMFGEHAERYFQSYLSFKQRLAEEADHFLDTFYQHELPSQLRFIDNERNVSLDQFDNDELVQYVIDVLEHLRTSSCVNFVKSARLGFYYSQRLQAMLENLGFSPEEVETHFALLTQGLEGSAITDADHTIARAETIEEAIDLGYNAIGHYSTGEMLEIRHPRLKDSPTHLVQHVEDVYAHRDMILPNFEQQRALRNSTLDTLMQGTPLAQQEELRHVVASAQTYMALRETVKYHFVAEYNLMRDAMVELEGRLPIDVGDIFYLYPRELPDMIQNPSAYQAAINERKHAFVNYGELDMPSIIRLEDIDGLSLKSAMIHERLDKLTGKLLAHGAGINRGTIVKVEDNSTTAEVMQRLNAYKESGSQIILVARQMNLGHDPLIMAADGIVIENANIVSHGAQRARELGRGALGGIPMQHFADGELFDFDPETRTMTRVVEG
jgi:pyruvate,water dikinase